MNTPIPEQKSITQKADILIVEDAFIIADNIAMILTKNGHQVMGIAKNIHWSSI